MFVFQDGQIAIRQFADVSAPEYPVPPNMTAICRRVSTQVTKIHGALQLYLPLAAVGYLRVTGKGKESKENKE